MTLKPVTTKTPAQIKLEAMLAKARAHLAASSAAQVQEVLDVAIKNKVHDIDLSNVVGKGANEAEKEEALDAVISSLVPSASAASRHTGGSEATPATGATPATSTSLATAVASVIPSMVGKSIGVQRDIELNEMQSKAVELILSGKSCVLIGKAGTGKTTMMRTAMTRLIESKRIPMLETSTKVLQAGLPGVIVCSYTNKAVNNIRHAMPSELKPHTQTLHKVLEFMPKLYELNDEATGLTRKTMRFEPNRNEYNPLPESVKFVAFEESSMIGTGLYHALMQALPHEVQFLFIGDIRQLPPVFDTAILGYKMLELPVVELTEVYRQALESPILRCALTLDDGKIDEFRPGKAVVDPKTKKLVWPGLAKWNEKGPHGSLTFQPWQREVSPVEALGNLRLFFKMQWEAGVYKPEDDIILCPMNKEANDLGQKLLSCHNLNAMILDFLSKSRNEPVHHVIAGFRDHYWAVGDRVLFQKEDAVITKIVRNGNYLGKPPKPASIHMDRYGILDEGAEAEDSGLAPDYGLPVLDPALGTVLGADTGAFSEMDAEAMLNALGSVKDNDRVNSASHIITVFCPVTEVTAELTTSAEVNDLLGGHALTVHKAQGSEWERVYLVVHHTHKISLSRELIYTAFTRARTHLHVFIHPEGMAAACKNQRIKGNTIAEKAAFFKGKRDKDVIAREEEEERAAKTAKIAQLKAAVQGRLDECMDKAVSLWPDRRHDMTVKLLYIDSGNAAGVAYFGDGKSCTIKVSPTYLEHDMDDALYDTIPHELAHLYASRWFGCRDHSAEWKEIAESLGAKPEACHHMPRASVLRGSSVK